MTSKSSDIYEQLKNNLYQDDAIIGEAAGIAMGLVMMGTFCILIGWFMSRVVNTAP